MVRSAGLTGPAGLACLASSAVLAGPTDFARSAGK
jgi:hypothetical protein